MNAPQKVAGFALGLAAVFAVAFGVGATLGPDNAAGGSGHPQSHTESAAVAERPAGLSAAEVRRDMAGYQHVHPVMGSDGTWGIPVDLSAGDYRVFADFIPAGGDPLTLGADLHVAGRYDPRPLPVAATTAVVDGYTVTLTGNPTVNDPSTLTFSVTRSGKPVTDLQPYLGAYGHLVALRASDLAYLHVHPMGEPSAGNTDAGPEIAFATTIPSGGEYRLFLDFKHENVVRTAEFTLSAEPGHGH